MRVRRLLRGCLYPLGLAVVWLGASCERPESAQLASASTVGDTPSSLASTDASQRVLGRLGDRQLIVHRVSYRGPEGSDAPEQIEIAWRSPNRITELIDVGAPILTAAVWRDGVVALTTGESLVRLASDGRRSELDHDVIGEVAVSDDRSALAYARSTGNDGELVVRRGEAEGSAVTIARGFSSVGTLRFSEDGARVCFVGARNGGVIGVHVASSSSDETARCVTNCTLRTGEDWQGAFVEVPRDAASLRCAASEVSWTTRAGQHVAVALGGSQ